MTSTQRVEGINGIIKKYINLQNNLVEFFQGIQTFLQDQIAKAEYRDWFESLPQTNISTSASERIFPSIIKELKEFLTIEMYFIQKAQLDICLEYNAMLISSEEYEECETFERVSNPSFIMLSFKIFFPLSFNLHLH
jgi:hypothetical protein